ncbi:Rv3235 family protein [Sanguibacter sp. HDW7]|uniref:Rv3235 family protein n=1 Tax=Sanguibacter sp. HDW7 TaxID=2714931 RepID=UPI001409D23E|nr:Rv3235 family protein [Sanguibacter sp. HDW7]QIK82894.1 energy transducer TonB [Sanguibacter sp. HDW7]
MTTTMLSPARHGRTFAPREPAPPRGRPAAPPVVPTTAPRIRPEPFSATAAPRERTGPAPALPVPAHVAGRTAGRPGDPTALACSITQAVVEALRGVRPLAQLTRWLAPEIHAALARRCSVTLAEGPGSTRPARVRRARVHRVDDRAAEATVVIEDLDRVRAAALRLEHVRGAWRVTALVLG